MPTHASLAGLELNVSYPEFTVHLHFISDKEMKFEIKEGPFAKTETVSIQLQPLGNSKFIVTWVEQDGATVTNVQDYDAGLVHSTATLKTGEFLRMTGDMTVAGGQKAEMDDQPKRNKALVFEAMTALFQRHDAAAVERLYSEDYIQHNPDIPQGRDALQALVGNLPKDVYYEPGLMIAEGSYVAIHGRIKGWADEPQVVVDIFRVSKGKLAEHWDVLQNEIPVNKTQGGISMFSPDEGTLQS